MNLTMEEMQAVEEMYLEHSGVMGMHWGQRRYQNPDGSLTALGRIHYGIGQRRAARAQAKKTKVMQSGDIKTVLKYRKKLTDEEFDTAMNRIAKTEALRSKERAEKEAKQRAKDEARAAKDKINLRKEELDNAKDIAKIEAKTKVKADKSGNLIKKGLAIATSVAAAYGTYKKIANMISDLTGTNLPGVGDMTLFGKKDSGDKPKNEPKPKDEQKDKPKNEPKPVKEVSITEVMDRIDTLKKKYGQVEPRTVLGYADIDPAILEKSAAQLTKQAYSSGTTWGPIKDLLEGW